MWLLQLLLLFAVYSVGPGLFFVRRLRLSPAEKLVTAVALSYFLVYLGSFGIFVVAGRRMTDRPDVQRALHMGLAAACLLLTIASFRDLMRIVSHRAVRRMLVAYGMFVLWGLVLLAMVRSYGGGTWSGDWLEHFQRALFYLGQLPSDYLFLDKFTAPARPPLMNAVAATFLAPFGPDFDIHQLVLFALNSLAFLPCCLIAGKLAPGRPRGMHWLLVLLFAANPMVVQNLTYAWTKLFAAFYAILALHLYLRGWRKGSRTRMVLAFAGLCAGMLVHYSVGPYAVFVGLHYLLAVFPRRSGKWVEAGLAAAACVAVLAAWLVWSMAVYGPRGTVASTSTVTDVAPTLRGKIATFAGNLANTLFTSVLRRPGLMADEDLDQPNEAGKLRDFAFLAYQHSLPLALGSGGMIVGPWLLWRLLRPPRAAEGATRVRPAERRFWIAFIPFVTLVGVAVHTGYDRFGLVHICLHAMVLLGLTLIAAGWRLLPPALRWVLAGGLVLDFGLGILLHFILQHRLFPLVEDAPNMWRLSEDVSDFFSRAAQANLMLKQRYLLSFVGDLFVDGLPALQAALCFLFILILCRGLLGGNSTRRAARTVAGGNAPPRKNAPPRRSAPPRYPRSK